MGKKNSQNKPFKLDDYDAPTEPVEHTILPMHTSPAPMGYIASQEFLNRPVAYPAFPDVHTDEQYPQDRAYPVLPRVRHQKYRGAPPEGAPSVYQPARQKRFRRSPLPGLVRFTFLLVQLVLLARLFCLLFAIQDTTLWLALLFVASDLFLEPIRFLAANINLSILAGTQMLVILEFVFALLAYGLLSRLLALLLRALLNP